MKKQIVLIWIIFIQAILVSYGQDQLGRMIVVKGGLKAEINRSTFILVNTPGITSRMNVGGSFGGFVRFDFSKYFALQGELLFHYRSSNIQDNGEKNYYQYWGEEIPIYAIGYFNLPRNTQIYFGIGPYAEFGFSATIKRKGNTIDLYAKDQQTQLSAISNVNSGFGLILGYQFPFNLIVNATCKMSATNIRNDNTSNTGVYPLSISIGIAYCFKKNKIIKNEVEKK